MAQTESSQFRFQSVILKKPDKGQEVDFTAGALELHIYESVKVPYLTARILIADTETLIENLKLTGTELITIELVNDDYGFTYTKDFYITRTEAEVKLGDNAGKGYFFYLAEDIFVLDILKKVSRGFRGTPAQIINNVLVSEFERNIKTVGRLPREASFSYVSPYISPLAIIETIRQRASDTMGFPYFVYASLKSQDITMKSLSTILETDPLNDIPFVYSTNQNANPGELAKLVNIKELNYKNTNDTLEMLLKGAIQTNYNVLNISSSQMNQNPSVNIPKILQDDNNSIYNKDFTIRDKKIEEYNPHVVYRLVNHTNQDELGLHDEVDMETHVNKAKAHGIRSALNKHMMEIVIPGLVGWYSNEPFIGNQIEITVPSSSTEGVEQTTSGAYVVLQSKHSFVNNKYDQLLTCSKLTHNTQRTLKPGPSGFLSL